MCFYVCTIFSSVCKEETSENNLALTVRAVSVWIVHPRSSTEKFNEEAESKQQQVSLLCCDPDGNTPAPTSSLQLFLQHDRGGQRSLMTEMEGCKSLSGEARRSRAEVVTSERRSHGGWCTQFSGEQTQTEQLETQLKVNPFILYFLSTERQLLFFKTTLNGALFSSCCSAVYLEICSRPDRSRCWEEVCVTADSSRRDALERQIFLIIHSDTRPQTRA